MNILISTIFWGKGYFDNFVDYSLASLLSKHNAPAAAADHTVTFVILTEKNLIETFKQQAIYQESCAIVRYEFHALEDYGFNATRIPGGYHPKKYQFLSVCQNIVIELSKKYDVHVFNYADFIWADGSLPHIIAAFKNHDIFALLGFCIPVDEKTVKPRLQVLKQKDHTTIELESHQAVSLALEHMHSEAALRNWNRDFISNFPSYLYWEAAGEGILIRAFHQTLLATAPSKGSAIYNGGIKQGTLDGSFSSEISRAEKTMIAADSEKIFVFSMFNFFVSSESKHRDKNEILRSFVGAHLSPQHLVNFQTPILLKKKEVTRQAVWDDLAESSLSDVAFIYGHVNDLPPHRDADVKSLASWKDPKELPFAYAFVLNWIMPRVMYLLKSIARRIKLGLRDIQASLNSNIRISIKRLLGF